MQKTIEELYSEKLKLQKMLQDIENEIKMIENEAIEIFDINKLHYGSIVMVKNSKRSIKKVIRNNGSTITCGDIGIGFRAILKSGRYVGAKIDSRFKETEHPVSNIYDYADHNILGVFVKDQKDNTKYIYIRNTKAKK